MRSRSFLLGYGLGIPTGAVLAVIGALVLMVKFDKKFMLEVSGALEDRPACLSPELTVPRVTINA